MIVALHENERVIVGCLVGAFIGGAVVATAWGFKAGVNDWDMWSAFGSIAAATVACGIALSDSRRRASDSLERARLVASFSRHKVSYIESEVNDIATRLEHAARFDCASQDFTTYANKLTSLKLLTVQDIEPLVPLPNSCAHNLAAGLDHMELGKTILIAIIYSGDINISDHRKEFAGKAAVAIRTAHAMLKSAGEELQAASFAAFGGQRS